FFFPAEEGIRDFHVTGVQTCALPIFDDELDDDEDGDSSEDELMARFNQMAFVVATRKLEQLPHWVRVTDVFKTQSDRDFLKKAGVTSLDDPRAEKYAKRLARLRAIRRYVYRM